MRGLWVNSEGTAGLVCRELFHALLRSGGVVTSGCGEASGLIDYLDGGRF